MLKEHNHIFAHAQEFDFSTGGQEIKDASIDRELSQIRLIVLSQLWFCPKTSQNQRSVVHSSRKVSICV